MKKQNEEDQKIADDPNKQPKVRERARERIQERAQQRNEAVNERGRLEEGRSLRECLKSIFKKYGVIVVSIGLAAGDISCK